MFFINTRLPHAALGGDRGRRAREFKAQRPFSVSISSAPFLSRSQSNACNIHDGLARYEEKAPRGTEFQLSGGGRSSLCLNRKQFSSRVQIIVP